MKKILVVVLSALLLSGCAASPAPTEPGESPATSKAPESGDSTELLSDDLAEWDAAISSADELALFSLSMSIPRLTREQCYPSLNSDQTTYLDAEEIAAMAKTESSDDLLAVDIVSAWRGYVIFANQSCE